MVYVLDQRKKPLMPCSEKRARLLLERRRARVHRMYPFTIRLIDRKQEDSVLQPLRLKIDPGSRQTGIAIVRQEDETSSVVSLLELKHRGQQISKALSQRAAYRRRRRSANLRYRAPRFDNRRRPEGWLPPSLQHRVVTTMSLVNRLRKLVPVAAVTQELVRFDTQLMENPDISGVEYQQGTLAGYEIREYIFEKWGRQCVYCDAENVPLNLDHIHPKAKGGSNRVSNLVPACIPCNRRKDSMDVAEFVKDKERLENILKQAKLPLKDAAAVNSTRWALLQALKATGLPVETGSGGRTKWNRHRLSIPKSHALDAVCAGNMDFVAEIVDWQQPTLFITASGRGAYQRTRLTGAGFPRGYLMRKKMIFGFQTGDMVKAQVPAGKKMGVHAGRVAIRESGYFNIQMPGIVVQGVSHKHCRIRQRNDGYGYHLQQNPGKDAIPPRP